MTRPLFLFGCLWSMLTSCHATLLNTENDSSPLEIEADSIEYISEPSEDRAIAHGMPNAIAIKGFRTIKAPEMIAIFEPSDVEERKVLKFLEANQGVIATENDRTLTGDKGVFNAEQELLTVTGTRVFFQTPEESLEAHESLIYNDQTHTLTASKEVSFETQGTIRGQCDHGTAHLSETPEGKMEIHDVELFGTPSKGVIFEDKSNPEKPILGHGNNAYYRIKDGKKEIFLLGNGSLVQGKDILTAPCIWIQQGGPFSQQETRGLAIPCENVRVELPPESALLTSLPLASPQRAKAILYVSTKS